MLLKQNKILILGLVLPSLTWAASPKPDIEGLSFFEQVLLAAAAGSTAKKPDTPREKFADFLKKLPGDLPEAALEADVVLNKKFCPPAGAASISKEKVSFRHFGASSYFELLPKYPNYFEKK